MASLCILLGVSRLGIYSGISIHRPWDPFSLLLLLGTIVGLVLAEARILLETGFVSWPRASTQWIVGSLLTPTLRLVRTSLLNMQRSTNGIRSSPQHGQPGLFHRAHDEDHGTRT